MTPGRVLACAVTAALLVLTAAATAGAATPRCFGAAARDPVKPCSNPRLRLSVTPSVKDAPLVRGTPCTRQPPEGWVAPCAFGSSPAGATGHFLLVGDSHAAQWRPAMDVLARRLRWRGYAITRNGCTLSTVTRAMPEPYLSQCNGWKPQVIDWLTRHPEVTTVFLAQKTPEADDFAPNPPVPFDAQVSGHMEAWGWLPASVQRVLVIRDNPSVRHGTLPCVSRALRRRRSPGKACAVPARTALPPDPAAAAVARLATPRFQLVDLSRFFCDTRSCYPVVGGVLVFKDVNHITRHFAETLAPFILRSVAP